MTDLRRRSVQFRAAPEAGEGVVRGYVTTWDDPYNIGWGWQEEIARGAFSDSLRAQDAVPIMYQHDWDAGPIGVTRTTTEDDHGLLIEAELFLDDPRARSIWRAMAAGALREWSIGFYAEEITEIVESSTDRVVKGRLAEASVVVRGANPSTSTLEVRNARKRDADPDNDPAVIAQAIDATNDELAEALASGDIESAKALSAAVDMAVDRLLVLLGVPDPGEVDGTEETSPGSVTDSGEDESTEREFPADLLSRLDEAHVRELYRTYLSAF